MAMLLSKNYFSFQIKGYFQRQQFSGVYTWYDGIEWKCGKRILRNVLSVLVGASATCGVFLYFLDRSVQAMGRVAHLPSYPWDFEGYLTSLDHSAVRRGWQVYRTICHTCHSLRYVRFMDLIDVSHTKDEVKAIAAEYEIQDGPDEEGNYYMRPGRLSDLLPPPYPNEEAARAANFGAYPPDLTYIIFARKNGRNYLFSLLTGWTKPPAGISLSDQQYFNIYFPGNVISMEQMLVGGVVEYDDGTPSTTSQMAKDIVAFLSWTSSQEFDERKRMFIKAMGISIILLASIAHYSRFVWSHLRSRQIAYVPKEKY
ncbi:PREDICTED: cytochrome c1-2, heme protein, mitochondrial-like [Trachymyrmex cornetzi]|uniref:Cytochrome c1, heme protein, mitochondrial n=1 Tax=Trachymyrmex cornetzi TaxID=471704 RepID=A0A195E5G8_9HYME|nr:PREDICTED: cytochrome c1-2, heme protein, mitochondrial-like [Trachymyrmex cornetzi]KYN20331.1 Cytochrome c1, heme protein, mitochondrial [Trachymyrmex cornetzi]